MSVNWYIGRRRLLKLADFLASAEMAAFARKGKFYMGSWSSNGVRDDPRKLKYTCGTSACAMGWATTIPSFNKVGLKMNWDGIPIMEGRRGESAAEELFGISNAEACRLFVYPPKQSRPKAIAQLIRRMVACKDKEAAAK